MRLVTGTKKCLINWQLKARKGTRDMRQGTRDMILGKMRWWLLLQHDCAGQLHWWPTAKCGNRKGCKGNAKGTKKCKCQGMTPMGSHVCSTVCAINIRPRQGRTDDTGCSWHRKRFSQRRKSPRWNKNLDFTGQAMKCVDGLRSNAVTAKGVEVNYELWIMNYELRTLLGGL